MDNEKKSGVSIGTWFFVFLLLLFSFAFCFMYYKISLQVNELVAQRNMMLETLISIETKLDVVVEDEEALVEGTETETETSEISENASTI